MKEYLRATRMNEIVHMVVLHKALGNIARFLSWTMSVVPRSYILAGWFWGLDQERHSRILVVLIQGYSNKERRP